MSIRFVAECEIGVTQEELEKFSNLSKLLNIGVPEVIRLCMNEHCDLLLQKFNDTVPDAELKIEEVN